MKHAVCSLLLLAAVAFAQQNNTDALRVNDARLLQHLEALSQ